MTARTLDEVTIVEAAVSKAVADAGLPEDSPIHATLVFDSQVYDGYSVCVPDPEGRSVSLQQRIEQMRSEERWRREFARPLASRPGKPSGVAAAGAILTPDRSAFADIVAGKTVVR